MRSHLSLLPALALAACASSGSKTEETPGYQPPREQLDATGRFPEAREGQPEWYSETTADLWEQPIGFYMSSLDRDMRLWNRLKLEAQEPRDIARLDHMEESIRYRAQLRRDEIVEQLELGGPRPRAVAAMALGFTGDVEAQSPLLAALSDRNDDVVNNALAGIGMLAFPDTPLLEICTILRTAGSEWTRSNAAYALQRLVEAGAEADCVVPACRQGLIDSEAGVRVQCARVLALELDTESIPRLGDLLYDDTTLVTAAAANALASIGSRSMEHKGDCARRLVDALDTVPNSRRGRIVYELVQLSGRHLGDEAADWREWAHNMP